MKLVLIALATEVLLTRAVAGTWLWALALVALYCTIVYVMMQRRLLMKKQDKTKAGYSFPQRINRTNKTKEPLYYGLNAQ